MNGQSSLLGNGGERILNTIKRNPEGLLLLAAGAVLLMRTNASKSSATPMDAYGRGAQASERMEDAARQTMDTARSYASSAGDAARRTMDTARSYAKSASDAARETMENAKSHASSASQYASEARRAVGEQSERVVRQTRSMAQGILQNQPLAIAAAGLAVGAALAAAFPATQLERETLGPMGDQMSKAAERWRSAETGHHESRRKAQKHRRGAWSRQRRLEGDGERGRRHIPYLDDRASGGQG
jgi:hypothetical protein